MPNLSSKASDIHDVGEMVERIAYRNKRIITRIGHHDDPVAFATRLAGHARADLRRLAEMLEIEMDPEHN